MSAITTDDDRATVGRFRLDAQALIDQPTVLADGYVAARLTARSAALDLIAVRQQADASRARSVSDKVDLDRAVLTIVGLRQDVREAQRMATVLGWMLVVGVFAVSVAIMAIAYWLLRSC